MKQIFIFLLIFVILFSCQKETLSTENNDNDSTDVSSPELPGWKLVWNDEFDGETIDTGKWRFETGGHGWGNNELQYYTDSESNSYLEDGKLIIQALKETYNGNDYTSARINSIDGWFFKRIDVKAKLPYGIGTWPAIWMLPDDWIYGNYSWPDNGEIDIMEHVGSNMGYVHASIHCDAYNHKDGTQKSASTFCSDVASKFHVYSIDWRLNKIDFYFDDELILTFEKSGISWEIWPFDHPFHLLLNIAIGGSWGGSEIDNSAFPCSMEIDYVRVWEKENE